MRGLTVLVGLAATAARAQEPTPPPPPPPTPPPATDSVRAESTPVPPPPPSPEQKRFLDGLRTATRGIAQLKDGLNRVTRTQSKSDSVSQRRAGRLLAGLCGSARDRKSTRLNSSHGYISYAVFCLKQKMKFYT